MKNGLVAGTLVHTDKGLVPIEQLKVGDMVLSKHESNTGEQASKRVVSTFKSATRQPIMAVKFYSQALEKIAEDFKDYIYSLKEYSPDGQTSTFDQEKFDIYAKELTGFFEQKYQRSFHPDEVAAIFRSNYKMHIFCTENHPFWVEDKGWVPADQLESYDLLQGYDQDALEIKTDFDAKACGPLYKSSIAGIASYFHFDEEDNYENILDGVNEFVDFRFGQPTFIRPSLVHGRLEDLKIPDKDIDQCLFGFRQDFHPLENVYCRLNDPDYPRAIKNNAQDLVSFPDENILESDFFYGNDIIRYHIDTSESEKFEDYVYNIEVEDFHTYYVGFAGVLVKASNIKLRLVEPFIA